MKNFTFDGNWGGFLKLEKLSRFNRDDFFDLPHLKNKLNQGLVSYKIQDEFNLDPNPSSIQVAAIDYILNNEDKIITTIFETLRDIVSPWELNKSGWELPELNTEADLINVIGTVGIKIDSIGRNEVAWTLFYFEYYGDPEHGLCICLERNKFMAFSSYVDYDHDEILTKEEYEEYEKNSDYPIPYKFYPPTNKSGKLKPWQIAVNSSFLSELIEKNQQNELISLVENNLNLIKNELDSLISEAKFKERNDLVLKLEEIRNRKQ